MWNLPLGLTQAHNDGDPTAGATASLVVLCILHLSGIPKLKQNCYHV
jgi:hypothetical protein